MARLLVAVFGFCLLVLGAGPAAHAAKRVAFVVGIDSYDNLPQQLQLRKAVNDAQAVSEALAGLGYEVQKSDNIGRLDFLRQWQLFLNRLEPGDEAAVFFAGHGVEIDGQNFLLPRDVPRVASGENEVLKASALSLSALLDQVRDRNPQVGLYIIDACRDNPFVDDKGRGIGGTRGLARVEPPSGTFIMFSAGAKESALDRLSDNDPNPNSVYTRTLLPRLKASGRITDIARDVRREVRELAASVAHVQTPAYYDEVVGDFCPAGCETKTVAAQPQIAPAEIQQPQAEAKPVETAAAPSSPPIRTAVALTPQAVRVPAPGQAPVDECDRLAADENNPDSVAPGVDYETLDPAKAIPACEAAVRSYPNERRFSFQLGRAYLHAKKYDLAKQRLETLSNNGYPVATSYLAFLYAQGKGVEKDEAKAQSLIRQAADAGDALGALALGNAYEWGQYGFTKSEAEALRWYDKAAERGNVRAALVLGEKYSEGKLGLVKDDAAAARLFRKAAERGDVQGLYNLGLSYWDGRGLPKDQTQAEQLFAKGDESKNTNAMLTIAGKFERGVGITVNAAEALKWYRKAADLGDQDAMFSTALVYHRGEAVPKDTAEAARWYRKAADLGHLVSMRSLAGLYEDGDGVPKDANEALRWRRAAKAPASPPQSTPIIAKAALVKEFPPLEYDPVSLAFAPGGTRLLALASGGYFAWLDPDKSGEPAKFGQGSCCQVVISPNGRLAATGSYDEKAARLWNLETGEIVKDLEGHSEYVVAVSFSSDGKLLASGSYDTTVILWDVANRKMIRKFEPSEGKAYSVAFSPDGALLASGHVGGEIKLWDVASGKLRRSFKSEVYAVESLAFTPDGRLLAGLSSFTIDLWDVAAGTVARSLKGAAALISFKSMAMSPDGTTIVTGDTDGSIRVWDVAEGRQLQELEAHVKPVDTVAFSPDGRLIASASDDKTVKLWSLGSIRAAGR